ncbi:hypothetical protein VTO42DRAFT_4428 [Malbranchea cinnamomea]
MSDHCNVCPSSPMNKRQNCAERANVREETTDDSHLITNQPIIVRPTWHPTAAFKVHVAGLSPWNIRCRLAVKID